MGVRYEDNPTNSPGDYFGGGRIQADVRGGGTGMLGVRGDDPHALTSGYVGGGYSATRPPSPAEVAAMVEVY